MKEFTAYLHRDYKITITAKNKEVAKFLAEYVIGGEKDVSTNKLIQQFVFEILEIDVITNKVIEVEFNC